MLWATRADDALIEIPCEMRISRGGIDHVVTKQLADHRERLPERQRPGGEGVTQVMDSHVVEVRGVADAAPGVLEIGQMAARIPADEHQGVVLRPGQGEEDVHRRAGEGNHPRTGLGIGEQDHGSPTRPVQREGGDGSKDYAAETAVGGKQTDPKLAAGGPHAPAEAGQLPVPQ